MCCTSQFLAALDNAQCSWLSQIRDNLFHLQTSKNFNIMENSDPLVLRQPSTFLLKLDRNCWSDLLTLSANPYVVVSSIKNLNGSFSSSMPYMCRLLVCLCCCHFHGSWEWRHENADMKMAINKGQQRDDTCKECQMKSFENSLPWLFCKCCSAYRIIIIIIRVWDRLVAFLLQICWSSTNFPMSSDLIYGVCIFT